MQVASENAEQLTYTASCNHALTLTCCHTHQRDCQPGPSHRVPAQHVERKEMAGEGMGGVVARRDARTSATRARMHAQSCMSTGTHQHLLFYTFQEFFFPSFSLTRVSAPANCWRFRSMARAARAHKHRNKPDCKYSLIKASFVLTFGCYNF